MNNTSVCLLFLVVLIINGSLEECDKNYNFMCKDNSTCIENYLACDGAKHCPDGSDETQEVCSDLSCPSFLFRCAYGACINFNETCDGKQNCADGSDENPLKCGSNKNETVRPNNSCPKDSFACDSKECIKDELVCDGELNCSDGSDETIALCIGISCSKAVGYQCAYGACIDRFKKCDNQTDCKDGSDEFPSICEQQVTTAETEVVTTETDEDIIGPKRCRLPDQQFGGYYSIHGCDTPDMRFKRICRAEEGTPVDQFTVISFECYNGYGLDGYASSRIVCIDGVWSPSVPKCLKLCPPLKSNSLKIQCNYRGSEVNCSKPMLPNTKANFQCKNSYKYNGHDVSLNSNCDNDGVWTESLFRCKPQCGVRTHTSATLLVSKGIPTSTVEFPWYTGLYQFSPKINEEDLFCGGSIITPYLILTAAHCFEAKDTDPRKITAIVGKSNRSFKIHDPGEQRLKVSAIFMHTDYNGPKGQYAFDLAVLELTTIIEIGSTAMPVCVETIRPWTVLENGTPGIAVGFGRDESGSLTDKLMGVRLPYKDQFTCWKENIGSLFNQFITHEKFCGIYVNGSGVQKGDSGGGIVFQDQESKLYYIRGIVSLKQTGTNEFATFTNISWDSNYDFIAKIVLQSEKKHR